MNNPLVLYEQALFHITHIKNIPSMLKNGILSKNLMRQRKMKYQNISYDNIQEVRAQIKVPGTHYTLHDYAPCFFGARSPMLYAVMKMGVLQDEVIYALVDWDILNLPTTRFTDGNARTGGTKFYQGTVNLCHVDFKACNAKFWHNEGEDFRRRKQAEALKFQNVTLGKILGFVVRSDAARSRLGDMLQAQGIQRKIFVVSEYYYA